jgi:hypothetical protein
MITYTLKEKKEMLARMIWLMVHCGYGITDVIGKPLSYFDFHKVFLNNQRLEEEYYQISIH